MAYEQETHEPQQEEAPLEATDDQEAQKKRLKQLVKRLTDSGQTHADWEEKFNCDMLEEFYAGQQESGDQGDDYYILNQFFPAVEVRLPQLMYQRPRVHVSMRPGRADDLGANLDDRAKLIEEIANHFIHDPDTAFREETLLATKESLYRFGVVEVGYSANPIENPNVGKPALDEKGGALTDENGPVLQPATIIESELLFVKRIPAKRFRFPAVSHNLLHRNDWVAYYDWAWPSDLKRNAFYNPEALDEIKSDGDYQHPESRVSNGDEDDEDAAKAGMHKVWRFWDLRTKMRHVFREDGCYFLLENEPFEYLPLAMLKFHELLDSALPMPWLAGGVSPQLEMNEARNMMKSHRRRFVRRYAMRAGGMEAVEIDKLTGPPIDGQVVIESVAGALRPIEDAQLGSAAMQAVPQSQADFSRILGIGGEAQGVAESDTATQASIIDTNMKHRETFAREIVAGWLSRIVWLILKTARDRLSLDFVIKTQVDPSSPTAMEESMAVAQTWQLVQAKEIGDMDFGVEIDIESIAPDSEDRRREQWNQVLSLFSNPQLMQVLASSDTMLRRTLQFYGLRSNRDLNDIKQAMIGVLTGQIMQQVAMSMGVAPGGPPQGGPGPGGEGPSGPPSAEQQANAITGQMAAPTAP